MRQKINSFLFNSENQTNFVDKFTNMDTYYRSHDKKPPFKNEISTTNDFLKSISTSRKSILCPSPRKSIIPELKTELGASERNKNIIKAIDLLKYTPNELLDVFFYLLT